MLSRLRSMIPGTNPGTNEYWPPSYLPLRMRYSQLDTSRFRAVVAIADPVHHVHQRGLLAQAERRAENELHGERLTRFATFTHHPVANLPPRFAKELDRAG